MKNFIKDHRFIAGLLSIFISVFLVSIVAYGATTIGTNITTEGYTTSTVGIYSQGVLDIGGNGLIRGKATTSIAFSIGSVATVDHLNMTGGDLYVQDDVEIDGLATSTEGFYSMGVLEIGGNGLIRGNATVDGYVTSTASLNTQGTGHIGGALTVDGNVTTLGYASSTASLNTQGTLHVGGNVTIDGKTTTTDYIYLPRINFQQGVVTSTEPNIGECFMPKNEFTCWDGTAWQYAW